MQPNKSQWFQPSNMPGMYFNLAWYQRIVGTKVESPEGDTFIMHLHSPFLTEMSQQLEYTDEALFNADFERVCRIIEQEVPA